MALLQPSAARPAKLLSSILALLGLSFTLPLTGCLVAGVSSGGGFFIWPGSIGLMLILLLLFFFLRRGR